MTCFGVLFDFSDDREERKGWLARCPWKDMFCRPLRGYLVFRRYVKAGISLSACPHTNILIPKLYKERLYKESSYKFQCVHTHKKLILKLYSETLYRCAVCYCGHETEAAMRGQVSFRVRSR